MHILQLKPLAATLLVASGLGCTLSAQAEGLYVGAGLGTPHYSDNVNGTSGEGSGISGKVFGGYQLTPNFAIEAGLSNLGHIDNASGSVNSHAQYIDAVALAPLTDKWSLLGSLGMAHVEMNTSNGDGSGNGLKVGLGAQYALSSNMALRGEWERYRADAFGAKPAVDQYTMGVRVAF